MFLSFCVVFFGVYKILRKNTDLGENTVRIIAVTATVIILLIAGIILYR